MILRIRISLIFQFLHNILITMMFLICFAYFLLIKHRVNVLFLFENCFRKNLNLSFQFLISFYKIYLFLFQHILNRFSLSPLFLIVILQLRYKYIFLFDLLIVRFNHIQGMLIFEYNIVSLKLLVFKFKIQLVYLTQ